jgi:purine-binding chemotaxis protein CheW
MDCVVFSVGTEEFAISITHVKEVQRIPQITVFPGAPESIDGVVTVRNHSVAVIQLQKRLGVAANPGQGQVVVVAHKGMVFGLVVDRVSGIVEIASSAVDTAPAVLGGDVGQKLVTGIAHIGSRNILMLDVAMLMNVEELSKLR